MDEIIEKLRDKDEKAAYEFAKKIGIESAESDKYVEKIPVFSEMLTDKIQENEKCIQKQKDC